MIFRSPHQVQLKDTIISIGNFDGLHLGHQMLLKHMQDLSQALAKASIIISFFPPARHFFQGGEFLSSEAEKIELLSLFKPEALVMIPFDQAYAQTPKEAFVEALQRLEPDTLIVGEDFRFGYRREGSLNDLSTVAQRLEVFNLKQLNGQRVSSTRIRELLKVGQIAEVKALLQRCRAGD
jgi:riboflavin kinase / FMN adenylyltransferase